MRSAKPRGDDRAGAAGGLVWIECGPALCASGRVPAAETLGCELKNGNQHRPLACAGLAKLTRV